MIIEWYDVERNGQFEWCYFYRGGQFILFPGVTIPNICRVLKVRHYPFRIDSYYEIFVYDSWVPFTFGVPCGGWDEGIQHLLSAFRIWGKMQPDLKFMREFYEYCVERDAHEEFRMYYEKTVAHLSFFYFPS
mgnify:CR=1 FL=1